MSNSSNPKDSAGGNKRMKVSSADKAVAIVGVGAIMPDASNAPKFWQNIKDGRYSITEVSPNVGIPLCITIRIRKLRTRPIRKSEAGCGTGNGIR